MKHSLCSGLWEVWTGLRTSPPVDTSAGGGTVVWCLPARAAGVGDLLLVPVRRLGQGAEALVGVVITGAALAAAGGGLEGDQHHQQILHTGHGKVWPVRPPHSQPCTPLYCQSLIVLTNQLSVDLCPSDRPKKCKLLVCFGNQRETLKDSRGKSSVCCLVSV